MLNAYMTRALAFGRHIPASKLVRRVELSLRRTLRDRLRLSPSLKSATLARCAFAPTPLFGPRSGRLDMRAGVRHFTFVGHTEAMRGNAIDWLCPGPQSRHQLWRMNLHYMEYLEDISDDVWSTLVDDWIGANPASARGAWKDSWNSYAISLRCVVWMQELARREGRLPPASVMQAEASLVTQLSFLENNLETDIGGNHLVKNVKALLWASAFFIGAVAARWRERGLSLLTEIVTEQVLADGVHYERSPSYQCQVFADLLEIRHALQEDPLGGALDNALARMAQAVANLAHPDGGVALFNDAGLTMAYSPRECLEAYAHVYGARPLQQRVFALEHAGYFGLRNDNIFFIADCGRIAPDDLPAHAHADALSFELSVEGVRMIVDQGVYEYNAGARRQFCRAASHHNTLSIEGVDQADFFGSFRCGRRPNVDLRELAIDSESLALEGAHDGFAHLHGAPRHVRRFEANGEHLSIRDRIEGMTDRAVSISFLLHPGAHVDRANQTLLITSGTAFLSISSTLPFEIEDAVWWPDMGVEQPTKRLRLCFDGDIREAVTTIRFARPNKESNAQ